MLVFKKYVLLVLLFFCSIIYGQEIYPIKVFTPQDYRAEDQNWALTQSKQGFIYAANNSGLLEYNGATWRLFKSPNDGILRSVNAIGERIYSGGYMDFGYWLKNEYGSLEYTSLLSNRDFKVKTDEEFWKIINLQDYVLFQSLESIYIYNVKDESFTTINSDVRINKIFKVDDVIYFQKDKLGIFKIQNGKPVLILDSELLNNEEVINMYPYEQGFMVITKSHGIYKIVDNNVSEWDVTANKFLSKCTIYSSIKLQNGNILIGTISNGIIEINQLGDPVTLVEKTKGLSNNTVLSLMQDNMGNAWLGLDNGINVLNLDSPFKVYKDKLGALGTIYTSAIHQNAIYLGTNQGLFYRPKDVNIEFKLIDGTKGQVWFLEVLKGQLFCGHDQGTFIIDKNAANKVSDEFGTWTVKEIKSNTNLLLQGNYKGLHVLERNNNRWKLRNKIKGFEVSSRYLEFFDSAQLLVNHELKGLYKIKIDSGFTKVIDYKQKPLKKGAKSSIVNYQDQIIYSNKKGVYRYEAKNDEFKKDSVLSAVISGNNYYSGKLIFDKTHQRLWGFNKNEIVYVKPGNLSNSPIINTIHIPHYIRKNKTGYENILALGKNKYLIGGTDGYLMVNIQKYEDIKPKIHLNQVSYGSLKAKSLTDANLSKSLVLSNKNSSINFKFSVPNYNKLSATKYQYRLIGLDDNWSQWLIDTQVNYENLPHGDYTFQARAKLGNVLSSNLLSYKFSIEKPWSIKPLAIVIYTVLFFSVLILLHYFNRQYYKKQKKKILEKKQQELEIEQLENKRKLIQFKNENLQLNIENKNKELGTATMNLVKRNELLNDIKVRLISNNSLDGVKSVIKLIDKNLNNTNDWDLFEEAFNNVDKDFMKKLKELHPSITPNDLRLCTYLRLNLSSKEIAPLLNISHKSVEVKRYRLRKKMNLSHDQSLANYILSL